MGVYFVRLAVFLSKTLVWMGILLLFCRQILPLLSRAQSQAERTVHRLTHPLWLFGVWLCRMLGIKERKEGLDAGCIAAEILLGWMLLCLGLAGIR